MKRTEAIAWLEIMKEDAIFEQYDALKMAIEALQTAEINCVHCPRYYETEDDTGVHSHCGSHGRLIDADAMVADLLTVDPQFESMIQWCITVVEAQPTVQADRPYGEWILECDSGGEGDNLYRCSKCGCEYGCQEYDKPNFCLECGVRMYKGGEE